MLGPQRRVQILDRVDLRLPLHSIGILNKFLNNILYFLELIDILQQLLMLKLMLAYLVRNDPVQAIYLVGMTRLNIIYYQCMLLVEPEL
jgi:hypothetical protein